jgi:hypothetical protein
MRTDQSSNCPGRILTAKSDALADVDPPFDPDHDNLS